MNRAGTADDPRDLMRPMALFAGLSEAELERVATPVRMRRVPDNTNLISLEQRGNEAYLIVEGTVRVQVEQEDGSTVILAYLTTGDLVGEMGVVERSTRSATVKTLEDCRLLEMERGHFNDCLREIPRLAWNLLAMMSGRLRFANARIQLMRYDVAKRLARQLLAFADTIGIVNDDGSISIPLRLTQEDLANIIGASRERVNRIIRTWQKRKLIRVDPGHRIVLLDPDRLDDLYR